MRNLHPPGPQERLLDRGCFRGPDGEEASWTLHELPAGRLVVRVDAAPEGALWHMALSGTRHPERIQVRLDLDEGAFDAVYTFFDDEVLVWRRGPGGGSDAVALPAGYQVTWPPFPGRLLLALGALDASRAAATPAGSAEPATVPWIRLLRVDGSPPIRIAVGEARIAVTDDAVLVDVGDGAEPERLEPGENGRMQRWRCGERVGAELSPPTRAATHAPTDMPDEAGKGV